jgi:hypothetical protein
MIMGKIAVFHNLLDENVRPATDEVKHRTPL